jgi:pheromone shutdown protein TraB
MEMGGDSPKQHTLKSLIADCVGITSSLCQFYPLVHIVGAGHLQGVKSSSHSELVKKSPSSTLKKRGKMKKIFKTNG